MTVSFFFHHLCNHPLVTSLDLLPSYITGCKYKEYLNVRKLNKQCPVYLNMVLQFYIWFFQIDLLVEEIKDFKGISVLGFIHIDKPTVTTVRSHFVDFCKKKAEQKNIVQGK